MGHRPRPICRSHSAGVGGEQRKDGQDHPGPRPPRGMHSERWQQVGDRRQDLGEVVIPTVKQH